MSEEQKMPDPGPEKETTIYMHIGFHKTGTSAIQEFLYQNRETLLEHGVFYPKPLCSFPAHQELAYALIPYRLEWADGEYDRDEVYGHYREVFSNVAPGTAIIVSSEELCRLGNAPEALSYIKDAWKQYKVQVVAYVRDPVDFLISLYHHALKTSELADTFEEYVSGKNIKSVARFETRLSAWKKTFGAENVLIRDYDALVSGPEKRDLGQDLLALVGCHDLFESGTRPVNLGLHPWVVKAYTSVKSTKMEQKQKHELLTKLEELSKLMPKTDAAAFYLGPNGAENLKRRILDCTD